MNFTLLILLTAMSLGTACGVELGWGVMGVTTMGEPCSVEDQEVIFEKCVDDVAVAMGVDLSNRRLELRGNRDLSGCPSFCCGSNCPDCNCYSKGHYCFTHGCGANGRRLTVADEHVHTARFLVATGQIEQAVNECLDSKIEEYPCLGNPEDLTMKLFITE
jgi:hypothetical protein